MMQPESNDVFLELDIRPVRITVGGKTGLTLWFVGETDLLLSKGGRVQLFATSDELRAALISDRGSFAPDSASKLDGAAIDALLAAPPEYLDMDAAAAWLKKPDPGLGLEGCDSTLNAMNMAFDVAVTVGDPNMRDLFGSGALGRALDVLTFGLTLLGEGTELHRDPVAICAAVSPDAGAEAESAVRRVAAYVDLA
jgi:hypothetical protein